GALFGSSGFLDGSSFSFLLGAESGGFFSTLLLLGLHGAGGLCGLHALGEALNLTSGVHDALLARVERVTDIAEVDAQLWLGATSLEGVATAADHCGFLIVRVNSRLHV